ncbi:hypothetical protein GLYMA_07G029150v4 [Glycine max]|nr:hypothetical protein GLYMA_07G029150v4 [Glycine max]KAH1085107.1 hypothetical protein GYH30_017232 [Glycine max]
MLPCNLSVLISLTVVRCCLCLISKRMNEKQEETTLFMISTHSVLIKINS